MFRTQIQLTEEQADALKKLAEKRRVSVAELVREAVERLLKEHDEREQEKWRWALSLVGAFRSGVSDISVNHDKYLDEAYK